MAQKKISFEEAYEKLTEAAEAINNEDVSLESAIEYYKDGKKYYDICSKIIDDAKQLIEVYDKESDSLREIKEI